MSSGKPGAEVLQKIIGVGDEVDYDEERRVGNDLTPAACDANNAALTIYPLSRDDLRGDVFEDRSKVPRARRWVPYDGHPKTIARQISPSASSMVLFAELPPLAAGATIDNRRLRVFAKFGGTELTVRVEVLVDGVVKPEFSKEIPIVYPA